VRAVRKLFQLSRRELLVLVQAAALLPIVKFALRFTTVARLESIEPKPVSSTRRLRVETIARLVRIAATHGLYRAKCLEQSLVLRWLLLKQGIDSRMLVGTRKENGQVQAQFAPPFFHSQT
jgi:hypothetical protein